MAGFLGARYLELDQRFARAGAQFLRRIAMFTIRADGRHDGTRPRTLRHGTIDHGEQFLWPQNQRFATTYYCSAIRRRPGHPHSCSRDGADECRRHRSRRRYSDHLRPPCRPLHRSTTSTRWCCNIAQTQFRFLAYCMAKQEIVLGDARLCSNRSPRSNSTCWRWTRSPATPFRCIC